MPFGLNVSERFLSKGSRLKMGPLPSVAVVVAEGVSGVRLEEERAFVTPEKPAQMGFSAANMEDAISKEATDLLFAVENEVISQDNGL